MDPVHARRGLGRRLVDTAAAWAAEQGLEAVTLTTFAEVAWNAPYYARLGFTFVTDAEAGPGLVAVRRRERERGLDAWPRVSMRRPAPRFDVVDDSLRPSQLGTDAATGSST